MSLRVLLAALISVFLMGPVFAEPAASWGGDQPVFRSLDDPPPPTAGRFRYERRRSPPLISGGQRPNIRPEAPGIVFFPNNEPNGTVIIVHKTRKLYYTLARNQAYEYSISVGREGFGWTGEQQISRIVNWPDWRPPAEMRQRDPRLPKKMNGGLRNPLGAMALYLGNTLYRIHGTNNPRSIGRAASSGCFRMMNQHVVHLARMVDVGTTVKVVTDWFMLSF